MITFKVKDLMIQLPEVGERGEAAFCALPTNCPGITRIICPPRTFCAWGTCYGFSCPGISIMCNNTCPPISDIVDCPRGSIFPTWTPYIRVPDTDTPMIVTIVDTIKQTGTIKAYAEQGGDLAALQAQMREALDSVDEAVRARDEALAPKTAEEIYRLEEHLKAALDDLQERKARL